MNYLNLYINKMYIKNYYTILKKNIPEIKKKNKVKKLKKMKG